MTILQWFKNFDATLGSEPFAALHNYSIQLHTREATAQLEGEHEEGQRLIGVATPDFPLIFCHRARALSGITPSPGVRFFRRAKPLTPASGKALHG